MNTQTGILLEAAVPDKVQSKVAPSLERRRLRAYAMMLLVDAIILHFAFVIATFGYEGRWMDKEAILSAQAFLPVYFTIALYNASYSAKALDDWLYAARKAVIALIVAAALLNFLAFYTKTNEEFSRVAVTLGLILSIVFLTATRRMMPLLIDKFWQGRVRNQLVIEDGGADFALGRGATISAQDFELDPASQDPFMLDRVGKMLRNQDKVVVSCPSDRREAWAFLLKSSGVHGEIVSEPVHQLGAVGVHRYEDQDRTTLVVSTGPLGLRGRITKRLFDIVAALGGLIALAPLLIIIAILVKLEDGGPIFFTQRRLGRGNQFFDMLKFRSMRVEKLDLDGVRSTARNDDRITKIGEFIRRTSIDELPQLANVLKGDMALVGPRPHAIGSRANSKLFWEVESTYWQRHSLKPGLTGLAQVRGHRGATEQESDLTDRLNSDLEYISNWSLRGDILIVFQTLGVLRHDNAY
ncbi:MAG: sugar transferase [Erythrobacter sp.]